MARYAPKALQKSYEKVLNSVRTPPLTGCLRRVIYAVVFYLRVFELSLTLGRPPLSVSFSSVYLNTDD